MRNLKELTDDELIVAYVEQGIARAFDILLSRSEEKLFAYILYMVHDEETANDIFQETFVKVIDRLNRHQYSPDGKFCAWCMRIAHNVMMDTYRSQQCRQVIEADKYDLSNVRSNGVFLDNKEAELSNRQVLSDVKRIMDQLPEPQREVVYMRFYQDLSFKEIAEETGVSINTSLGRMRYAVLNMRRMAKANNIALQLL